jgi:fucose permease
MESKSLVQAAVWKIALYSFGLLNWFLYLGLAISSGSFFKKDTEQDRLQLDIGELSWPAKE